MQIEITITNDKGTSTIDRFKGDYYELHSKDWSDRVRESLDDMQDLELTEEMPQFKGTREALDDIKI